MYFNHAVLLKLFLSLWQHLFCHQQEDFPQSDFPTSESEGLALTFLQKPCPISALLSVDVTICSLLNSLGTPAEQGPKW